VGIALLRSDEASAFLIDLVEHASEIEVASALGALALHRHDAELAGRARRAVAARGSRRLDAILLERFGS
jgi:hypothetical protein